MKISEVIKKLQEAIESDGDLETGLECETYFIPMEKVEIELDHSGRKVFVFHS